MSAAWSAASSAPGSQYPLQLAAALAMTIPVAIIFFVFQKYIMRTGEGAIKE